MPTAIRTPLRLLPLLLAALLLTAAFASAPARAADEDVTWTVRTAPNSYGEDRSSYSYGVNPGGHVEDAMVVANRGGKPLTLTVYAADGFTTETGSLDLLAAGRKSVCVGAWLRTAAIKVKLRVTGALEPALAVEDAHVSYDGTAGPFARGDATLTYTIHNTGDAAVAARQTAGLTGPFGWFTAHVRDPKDTPELLPGERWKVTVPVTGVTRPSRWRRGSP
ncbi:hypothetical protein [Streptomyces sp. NPDC088923]|uniref:COG1470 family protein n=1 Tax=Streptomyces sp. NPDC088923 TaxID=3365913 RepID=UPI00380357C0